MAALLILRMRSGNARFCATVMCGQIAYDWKTMPRLRRSAARSMRASRSKKTSSPQPIRPASGVWKPAIASSVVVLPQPDGPSKVTSSLSRTVKRTSSRTLVSENDLLMGSIRMSGIARSPQDPGAEQEYRGDDDNLENRQGGDRADDSPLPGLQHRHPEDFGARFLQEHDGGVVAEQRDEHQHECG